MMGLHDDDRLEEHRLAPTAPFSNTSDRAAISLTPKIPLDPKTGKLKPFGPTKQDLLPNPADIGPQREWRGSFSGAYRFADEVRKRPAWAADVNSPEYDRWVLSLQPDSTDADYNKVLAENQRKAAASQDARAGGWHAPMATPGQKDQAKQNLHADDPHEHSGMEFDAWKKTVGGDAVVVDRFGNPIDPTTVKPVSTSQTANKVEDLGDTEGDVTDVYKTSGSAVWMGDSTVSQQGGRFSLTQAVYRDATDLTNEIFTWDPTQVQAFQKAMKISNASGVVDASTLKAWQGIVYTAAAYTAAGQKRTLDWVIQTTIDGKKKSGGAGRGRGGGGGGGGAGVVDATRAKALLDQVSKEYLGRESTAPELTAFLSAIRASAGVDGFDATQFTIDWVKTRAPKDVGAYQAATTYYDVIMSLIGGR